MGIGSSSAKADDASSSSSSTKLKPPSTLHLDNSNIDISGLNDVANRSSISTKPEDLFTEWTKEEKEFIDKCFDGLDADKLIDVHTHIVGVGTNNSGCFINYKMDSMLHPTTWIKKKFFLAACGVSGNEPDADLKVAEVLANLKRSTTNQLGGGHGKCHIFAFDQYYDEAGNSDARQTGFHVPNDWIFKLSAAFPDVFIPVASIHPYRKDAVKELARCYELGARMVKWLPNSQHINPSHQLCQPFYKKMKELNMVLLTHTGVEHSVDMAFHQDELGNPLLLRAPLDAGVRVIAAHCASEGSACICGHEEQELDQGAASHHQHNESDADEDEEMKQSDDGDDDDQSEESKQPGNSTSKRQKLSQHQLPPPTGTSTAPSSLWSLMFGKQTGVNLASSKHAQPIPQQHQHVSKSSPPRKRKSFDGQSSAPSTSAASPSASSSSTSLPSHGSSSSLHLRSTKKIENFDLFIKLMDMKKYEGLLFGDISSVTAHKRVSVLETLLNRQDLHHRLINGTDYPVPAVYVVIWSSQLRRKGLITVSEEKILNRIYKFNPLLFDFCLKRCMRSSQGKGFLDCCFHTPEMFADHPFLADDNNNVKASDRISSDGSIHSAAIASSAAASSAILSPAAAAPKKKSKFGKQVKKQAAAASAVHSPQLNSAASSAASSQLDDEADDEDDEDGGEDDDDNEDDDSEMMSDVSSEVPKKHKKFISKKSQPAKKKQQQQAIRLDEESSIDDQSEMMSDESSEPPIKPKKKQKKAISTKNKKHTITQEEEIVIDSNKK